MLYRITQLKSDTPALNEHIDFLSSSYFHALNEENQSSLLMGLRRTDSSKKERLEEYFRMLIGMDQHACLFVAEDPLQKRIGYFVGLIKECVAEIPSSAGYINGLYVLPEYRRQHVGQLLMDAGMSWFHEKKMKLIELYVSTGNADGKAFWKKNGFFLNEEIWVRSKN